MKGVIHGPEAVLLLIRSQCNFQRVIWCGWWIATQYNKLSAGTSTEIVLNDNIRLLRFGCRDDAANKQNRIKDGSSVPFGTVLLTIAYYSKGVL